MSTDLKPCPFCGGEAFVHILGNEIAKGYYIACDECGVKTIVFGYETKAIEAWNRRVVAENATTGKDAGYEPLGSRSWIIIKRSKLGIETVKQLFPSQESAEDYIRQASKKWGKAFMKGFAVEEVPVKVEKCQPEKPDDFVTAKRKGNDE